MIVGFSFVGIPVNIVFDGTFFGRNYGILVFRANGKNIYWEEIGSESVASIARALSVLDAICVGGYKSFTVDGRRGIIKLLKVRYPGVPIQHCQRHQQDTIRRYTTNNPKTDCGCAIKALSNDIVRSLPKEFEIRLIVLKLIFDDFLKERNEKNQFIHRRLRSAFRSLKTGIPYLFTTRFYPHLNIPNTTNSCEGSFSHWKTKICLHRGISHERRSQMINFILSQ